MLGEPGHVVMPAGGLGLVAGPPGAGKTTFAVDLAFHLASGLACYDLLPVPRPLHVLLIENEGPQVEFQAKLAAKRTSWTHELRGSIHVQVYEWAGFSFADEEHRARAGAYLDAHAIDLVVGDPLTLLGVEGVGSPEDTRRFVQHLRPLGLGRHRAFLLLHHFALEARRDEIVQLSGSWGGHLDALLTIRPAPDRPDDELRLAFPKLRWWRGRRPRPLRLRKIAE